MIAPAYALQGYHGVVVFLSIVAALGGALMWTAAYRLTESPGAAWFAWAAWALTVPFFFQAFSVFPDGLGATVVLFAAQPLLHEKGAVIPFQQAEKDSRPLFLAAWRWRCCRGFTPVSRSSRWHWAGASCCGLLGSAEGRSRLPAFLVRARRQRRRVVRVLPRDLRHVQPGRAVQRLHAELGVEHSHRPPGSAVRPAIRPAAVRACVRVLPGRHGDRSRARPRLAVEIVPHRSVCICCHRPPITCGGAAAARPARFAVPVLPLLGAARRPGSGNRLVTRRTRALGFALLAA